MKMMKYMTSLATALFALVACSDADDILSAYHNDPNAVHINAEVGKASADGFTRSNPLGKDADEQMKFNQDDEISVKADGQEAVTYRFDGSEWIPQDSKFLKWESENMNFTAYYPASYSGGTIDQPTEYTSVESLAAADYMSFNAPIDKPEDNNALTLIMERQMARVVVEIVGFNDQYDENTPINSVTINGVKAYKHSVDNKDKYYALMVPCKKQDDKAFLSLEVGTGNTETLKGIPALEAGKSYTYQLTVGKNKVVVNGITVKDWTTDKTINDVAKLDDRPYLTFTAAGAQTFMMTVEGGYTISGLEYSLNGGEWNKVVAGEGVDFGGPNSTLRLRGTNLNGTAKDMMYYSTITFTEDNVKVACTGDIRTLLDYRNYATVPTNQARFCYLFKDCNALTTAPDLPATVLAEYCYYGMFAGCNNLVNAPALPAETLAGNCYNGMFQYCRNLETPPTLPAKTLKDYCYSSMFWACTNLKTAPVLPADTLAPACYINMFLSCTNLKTAPQLPATTLAVSCYQNMFYRCTSLETAPALPAETLAGSCYQGMFRHCRNLSSVTMMASSDPITNIYSCCENWLKDAGTYVASHTLKVKDEDAYKALVNKSYLPGEWQKGVAGTTVEDTPCLTFTAAGPQTFKMIVSGGYDLSEKFEYSVNGGGWNEVVADKEVDFGGANGTLSLRGISPNGTATDDRNYSTINFTDLSEKVTCTGDIRTLLNHADYKNVATNQARFCYLFERCAALTSAPTLPARTLADNCYYGMFSRCKNLVNPPALPAETLADYCYSYMFWGCTSLKTAPKLPATTLASFCYYTMFDGCESLETAPTLSAETLKTACYGYMFWGCTSLKTAPKLPATTLALCCYEGMFRDCTSLETAPTLPATTLAIQCYNMIFKGCTKLSSVKMSAPSDQIEKVSTCCKNWLDGAGTDQSVTSRTLKVKDEAAYDALVNKSYLPAKWKKDQCTVKNESGTPIE